MNGIYGESQRIPCVDISQQRERHVCIAQGTPDLYQGHPTTVLMDDGKTMFATWSVNHGGPCGPLAKSLDGGKTWTTVETPENWKKVENCPSIYRMTDPEGKERLFVFAARPNMTQSYSEDGGETWTPMRELGMPCVMTFSSVVRLSNGDYLGLYHRGAKDHDRPPLEVWQTLSKDGGLTWGPPELVTKKTGLNPCEPCAFFSPDGTKLVCLLRENTHVGCSLMIFSEDEGKTWSEPVYTPWGLSGDRHAARYTADGRIFVCFRDMAPNSPTRNHFVGWVGTWEDIVCGRPGQYRVKLLHSFAGADCGYPGLELLPDGTLVATTYVKYDDGPNKHSVMSVRFKMEELDALAAAEAGVLTQTPLWVGGQGAHTYRIPSIVKTTAGTLLAFCEARRESSSDTGGIDLVCKRSVDGGLSWDEEILVWTDADNTCGNPCPVVDRDTGFIHLLLTWNLGSDSESRIKSRESEDTRRVFVMVSEDDGRSWSAAKEITAMAKKPEWTWYATGPGNGIQLRKGEKKGRLVIPCDFCCDGAFGSHVIVSDDHGETWRIGGVVPSDYVNECAVVELEDGRLLLNMRNADRANRARVLSYSDDAGDSWSLVEFDEELPEPICQAGFITLDDGRLVFSNPASFRKRKWMKVRLGRSDARAWEGAWLLARGPVAYSSLVQIDEKTLGCLYESGAKSPYESIVFARLPLSWF